MPSLTWSTKKSQRPVSARLITESVIFPQGSGYPSRIPESCLILGDNLAVMSALLSQYKGSIDLIYADPPFFTKRRYLVRVGRGEDSRMPQDWQLADGYPDQWQDIDDYLNMLYPRLQLMHELLAPHGTLYLHLDWHACHYARLLLDEIFGPDHLLNEIVWLYHGPSPLRKAFKRKHDTILSYTKSESYTFNADAVREPYNPSTVKTFASSPKAGFGKVPDLKRGKVPEDWWYYPVVARLHNERTGYPTQKPEALLERIILASSNPGDLVADFFCGSGTTPAVASRLGRRFIANDNNWRAITTTRIRLVNLPAPPFTLWKEEDAPIPTLKCSDVESSIPVRLSIDVASGTTERAYHAVKLDPQPPPNLEYWEIDPNWDGNVFQSAAQDGRSLKDKLVSDRLIAHHASGNRPMCVRLVFVNGEQAQIILKKPEPSGG